MKQGPHSQNLSGSSYAKIMSSGLQLFILNLSLFWLNLNLIPFENMASGPQKWPINRIKPNEKKSIRKVSPGPPTSEARVRFPAQPQVGKLVVACRWSAVYSTGP